MSSGCWFPFTNCDFYAYLTAGLTVVFAFDFAVDHGAIMLREAKRMSPFQRFA